MPSSPVSSNPVASFNTVAFPDEMALSHGTIRGEMNIATSASCSCFSTVWNIFPSNGILLRPGIRFMRSTVCRCTSPPITMVCPLRTVTLVDTKRRLMIGYGLDVSSALGSLERISSLTSALPMFTAIMSPRTEGVISRLMPASTFWTSWRKKILLSVGCRLKKVSRLMEINAFSPSRAVTRGAARMLM